MTIRHELHTTVEQKSLAELKLIQFSVENAAEAIFWIGSNGDVTYANQAAHTMLGYAEGDLIGRKVFEIDMSYSPSTWALHWAHTKNCGSKTIESSYCAKDGRTFPVEMNIKHQQFAETEFYCAFVRDITERKITEEKLRASEERFRLTLDATSNGMWDRDLKRNTIFYGSNWATALGYKDEDLRSGAISWEGLLHPDDKRGAMQAVNDHLAGKTPLYKTEFRLRNSHGQYQWILARGKVVEVDEAGTPLRFVGTHTDITERKIAEQELRRNSEQIKTFAYSVVHDLKSPAVAIHRLVKRLKSKIDDLPEEKILLYCSQLLTSSEQIVDLVEEINVYISSRETPVRKEQVPLKEVVDTIRDEFDFQLDLRSITWKVFDQQPVLTADRLSLLRVVRNLVDNALKYGGQQLNEIAIEYQETEKRHILSVRDNGVGLKDDDAETIFNPFTRNDSSVGVRGAGLGLAIVKAIAEQHKGVVWTESVVNQGAKFSFSVSKRL